MEVIMDNVRQYILALKEAGKFTIKDIASMSGVPIETVRNILSGKTSKNAGFATISKIIISMGGDLNEAVGYEKKKETEVNSIVSLKETSEMRIEDITKACETRIEDIIKACETRIEDIKKFCELRIADVQRCCDIRVEDMRRNFDERLKEQLALAK